MKTALIIAAIICVAAAAVNIYYCIHAYRTVRTYEDKLEDLDAQEKGLQKRHNALDLWNSQLCAEAKMSAQKKHIYANVNVSDENAPDFPSRTDYKKLASQFGYSVARFFRDSIVAVHNDDGTTTYKLDLYVSPYYDKSSEVKDKYNGD